MSEIPVLVRETVLLLTLGAEAVLDARKGLVSIWWMVPAVICGFVCNAGDMRWFWNVLMTLCCLAAGCGLSILTGGDPGLGDVWVLGCVCLNEGGSDAVLVLLIALIMGGCYGGGMMACKAVKKNHRMKFVPFLCAAYVIVLALRAV